MSIIADFTVPGREFVLPHALSVAPEVEVDVERVVLDDVGRMTPYFWASGPTLAAFEDALDDDPTIDGVTVVEEHDDRRFYRGEWVHGDSDIVNAVSGADATVLEAVGQRGRWELRLLFPDEPTLTAFHDQCRDHDLSFQLDRIHKTEHPRSFGKYEVTPEQREALVAALQTGYFAVPREVTLAELADELDISQQAASARLRRAYANLTVNALVTPTEG